MAYRNDESLASLVRFLTAGKEAKSEWLSPRQRSRLHRYEWQDGLLYYRVEPHEPLRVVVPNDEDLKFDILQEAHDAPSSGHLGREKTFLSVSQAFWWTHMYKWVTLYVKTYCWKSMSLDFAFGLPADDHGNTGILVFVCQLSKMVHLAPVPDTVTGEQTARLFVDGVFRHHGLPETFDSGRDPRYTAAFWQTLFQLLGTRLHMSTAEHPQTDGQTERVNRVLEDTLRSVCAAAPRTWSERLPVVEFVLNNAVHASTGLTPFYLNGMRHPCVTLTLRGGAGPSILSGGEARTALCSQVSDLRPVSLRKKVESFIDTRLNVINQIRDAMSIAQDRQKESLPLDTVSSVGSNKLKHGFIGPFTVLARHGACCSPDATGVPRGGGPNSSKRDQSQTSSNVQRRKAKTHAALVDREAAGTPEGLRTVEPQLGKPSTHRSHTAERTRRSASPSAMPDHPDLLKLAESLIHIGRGRPATNPIMEFRDLPAQLVQAVLKLREDPAIPGLGGSITASPETQSDLERQERVDRDDQPPRSAVESRSQAVHSTERRAPQEVSRTRSRTRAPPPLLDRNGETHHHVERVVRERRLDGKCSGAAVALA
ncbi:hypothetical protein C6341_g23015 [Phytophthora cactorum]|nr:hypothetical protein C6341_g23015 [Phytophthora cactorum]